MKFIDIPELNFLISDEHLDPGNKKKPGDYGEMTYDKANELISKLNDGSRLPNNEELKMIFENKSKIPNLSNGDAYWSSENSTEPSSTYGEKGTAYSMTMYSGKFLNGGRGSRDKCLVRLVKDKF